MFFQTLKDDISRLESRHIAGGVVHVNHFFFIEYILTAGCLYLQHAGMKFLDDIHTLENELVVFQVIVFVRLLFPGFQVFRHLIQTEQVLRKKERKGV